jgi:hypothetical protein
MPLGPGFKKKVSKDIIGTIRGLNMGWILPKDILSILTLLGME